MKKYKVICIALLAASLCLGGCGKSSAEDAADNTASKVQEESSSEEIQQGTDKETEDNTNVEDALTENTADETEVSEDEEEIIKEPDESPATGFLVSEHEKTLEGMKAYIASLPEDSRAIAKEGGIVLEWDEVFGMRNLEAFEAKYEAGEEAEILIMQYTTEGDPFYDYLYYDTEKVLHIQDASRDAFGSEESAFLEEEYPFYLSFTQKAEERDRLRTLVLSDNAELTYEEFENILYGGKADKTQICFLTSFFYTDADL